LLITYAWWLKLKLSSISSLYAITWNNVYFSLLFFAYNEDLISSLSFISAWALISYGWCSRKGLISVSGFSYRRNGMLWLCCRQFHISKNVLWGQSFAF
jgi:hypothetical protein